MHEDRRELEAGKVLGAQPLGFSRRVQRIGKQEERVDEIGLVGGEQRRLAPAIGLPAEDDPAGGDLAQRGDRGAQPGTVGGGARR